MKLLPKFLLLLVPFIIGPLLWLGFIAYQQISETSELKASNQLRSLIRNISEQTQVKINGAVASINLLASESIFTKYALTDDEEQRYLLFQRGLLNRFHAYQNSYPEYQEIRFILPDGYEDTRWASLTTPNITDNESKSNYFKQISHSKYDINVFVHNNPDTNKPVVYISKKIRLKNKAIYGVAKKTSLRGYLLITLNLNFLNTLIKDEHESLAIFNNKLTAVFRNKQSDNNFHLLTTALKNHLNNKEISKNELVGVLIDNQLYAAALVSDTLVDRLKDQLSTNLIETIIATITLSISALFLVFRRLIITPLSSIREASDKIKQGDLDISLNTQGEDEISELALTFNNMSKSLKEYNDEINFIAYHDSLTQLPNRRMFQYFLNNAIAMAKRKDELLALLFIDIDNFKTINDSLGHQVGDELLRLFAKRVGCCVRESDFIAYPEAPTEKPDDLDMIARLGGDEFTIVIPNMDTAEESSTVANRIIDNLSKPFIVNQHELFIHASIGITIYPTDADSSEKLIQAADIAMYSAKEKGKNNYQYYLASMNDKINNRLVLEHKLHRAIKRSEFVLYYQPQICLRTRKLYGVEALIRWFDPEEGLIPPDKFIPLAEDSGLIVDIGRWVMQEACRQTKAWHDKGHDDLHISVNVSTVQFYRDNLEKLVVDTLKLNRLPANYLDIELTESIYMDSKDEILDALQQIRSLGISLSLDDFGTGYSSLSYLRKFPTDILKIDRSFIKELDDSEDGASLVTAIIALAKVMGIKVVAEGVETQRSFALLRRIGCDYIQGYLIAKPLPAQEFEETFLNQSNYLPPGLFDDQHQWH